MTTKPKSRQYIAFLLIAIVAAIAGFAFFKQSTTPPVAPSPAPTATAPATATPLKIDAALLAVQPGEIVLGNVGAPVTIVEYSSLSCSHCAHFHATVLPDLQKDYLSTGKAKLVLRHFPLNEPAIKAAELVECAGQNGLNRANFMKVLFEMQAQWAFNENYLASLKQIALVGGLDSATFDSCMANKNLETKILASRLEVQTKLGIDSTPTFFINGKKYEGERDIKGFSNAIEASSNASQ